MLWVDVDLHLAVEVSTTFRCIHSVYSDVSSFKIMTFKLAVDLLLWRVAVAGQSVSRCVELCSGVQLYEGQSVWVVFLCSCWLCYCSTQKLCFFPQLFSYLCTISADRPDDLLMSVPFGC